MLEWLRPFRGPGKRRRAASNTTVATRTYLRRVPRWWAGKGPATQSQFAPCNQRRRSDETHTESRTRHARRQHQSRAHACTPTQILRNPKHRSIDSHLPAYRLNAREAALRTEVLPTRPSTLPSDECRQPPAAESLQCQNKLTAAAHSTPMASPPAT